MAVSDISGLPEDIDEFVDDRSPAAESRSALRWWARRTSGVAGLAVAVTVTESLHRPLGREIIDQGGEAVVAAASQALTERDSTVRVLDLCAGSGNIGAAAAHLGCETAAVELEPTASATNLVDHSGFAGLSAAQRREAGEIVLAAGERILKPRSGPSW